MTLVLMQGRALLGSYSLVNMGLGSDASNASAVSPETMAGARGSIVALACSSIGSLHRVIVVHSGSSPLVWDLRHGPRLAEEVASERSLGSDIDPCVDTS